MAAALMLWLVEWNCGLRLISAVVSAAGEQRACAIAGIAATQLGWPMGPDARAQAIGQQWADGEVGGRKLATRASASDPHAEPWPTVWTTVPTNPDERVFSIGPVASTPLHAVRTTTDIEEEIARRGSHRQLVRVIELIGTIGLDVDQPLTDAWRDDIIARCASIGARVTASQLAAAWQLCAVLREELRGRERQRRHFHTAPAAPAPAPEEADHA